MNVSKTACPACLSLSVLRSVSVVDHEYALDIRATYNQCAECHSFYQHPMPDEATLASYYPHDYHSFDANNIFTYLKHSQRLKSIVSLLKKDTFTMLDYGCGGGSFLQFAARQNPKATFIGYEVQAEKEIIHLVDKRAVIIKGRLENLIKELPEVDLITMHHVIEHLPDPYTVIKALYEKLSPGGFFIGQTPATDSLEYKIFQTKWSGFHAPRHTVIFSQKGMEKILKRSELINSRVYGGFNPGGIAVSLASLPQGNRPGRIARQGFLWLFVALLAALLYPIDLLSGQPGIINFQAQK
ncbi:MAG TPA: class I SAM-dependent methyltransferase [Candidatus Omnitrophota bacterium]|nr:class I SAM-dependent methyltransferase [Candidatus Omnitrophota bacterium]